MSLLFKSNGTYSFAVMSKSNDGGHYLSKEGGKTNGNIPYLRLHIIPKSENESFSDTGIDIDYSDDQIRDNVVFTDSITEVSDYKSGDYISDEPEADTVCVLCDEVIYEDIKQDSFSEDSKEISTDLLRKDVSSSAEESSGCSCNLLN